MIRKPFTEAARYIRKHPHILVPKIVYLTVVGILAFLLKDHFMILAEALQADVFVPLDFTSPEIIKAMWYTGGYGLFVFIFNVGFSAILFGLIDDVMRKDKCLLKHCKNHLKNYFKPVLGVRLWMGLVYFIGALVSFVPPMLLSYTNMAQYALHSFIITASLVYVLTSLALFFRYPILIKKKLKARDALKESYAYFKRCPQYTVIVAITMLVVGFAVSLLTGLIASIGIGVLNLVTVAIEFVVGVWMSVFLFSSYYLHKKK